MPHRWSRRQVVQGAGAVAPIKPEPVQTEAKYHRLAGARHWQRTADAPERECKYDAYLRVAADSRARPTGGSGLSPARSEEARRS